MSTSSSSMMPSSSQTRNRNGGHRPRTSSVSQAINEVNTYTDGASVLPSPSGTEDNAAVMLNNLTGGGGDSNDSAAAKPSTTASTATKKEKRTKPKLDANRKLHSWELPPQGLLSDIRTFRWMTQPASSAKLAGMIILCWLNWRIFTPKVPNPFEPFLFISHQVPITTVVLTDPSLAASSDVVRYQKGYKDFMFLLFYVIVFSCLRQTTTLYMFKPFAAWWGIKNNRKRERFMEQGYAFLYWGLAGLLGLYVMSFQDSWWYNMEHLWLKYPHWMMRPELKTYYLLQFSYWLQQALVMLLRLEAPRKDYYELIAHHLVTLWLIGWSYLVNLTMIGTTVFVCMDIPDTWLAMAKGANYLDLNAVATTIFVLFMFVWSYFRIYLSAVTLYSVWYQFDLVPAYTREWAPRQGWYLVGWMRYQIFTPLFLLLLLNLFWYALMWRVMLRAIKGAVSDVREDGEYDEDEE